MNELSKEDSCNGLAEILGSNEPLVLSDEQMRQLQLQEYLGDGVYVRFDGYHIWLQTTRGYEYLNTHQIALDYTVLRALGEYVLRLKAMVNKFREENKANPFYKPEDTK